MTNRCVLVHYHIFKNAGSSVDFALQRSFGSRWATFEGCHAHDVQTSEQLGQFLESRPELCAVSSHLARPPLPFSGCRPIVFLRHPLLRARSVYEFTRRDLKQHGSQISRNGEFSRYVRWALDAGREEGGVVIRDYQVVHLSGASLRTDILRAKALIQDLREAKSLIEFMGHRRNRRRLQNKRAAFSSDLRIGVSRPRPCRGSAKPDEQGRRRRRRRASNARHS